MNPGAAARPTPRGHYVLLGILLLALIIDGLDMQLLSLVSPLLLEEWSVDKAALGAALSAALVGMSGGAMLGGWLGDRWGRKRVLAASVFGFGFATIAIAFVDSLGAVTALRFVGGIGFGSAAPNAIALASEWLEGRLRARAISLMSIGAPLGGMLGAMLLIGVLSSVGWRGSFILCGLASIVIGVAIVAIVPESPSHLIARGQTEAAARLLRRWSGARDSDVGSSASHAAGEAMDPVQGVTWRFLWGTSLAFLCISFAAYACAAWTPLLATLSDLPIEAGLAAVFWFNLCAVAAAIFAGFWVPAVGSRTPMITGSVAAALGATLLMLLLGPRGPAAISPSGAFVAIGASLAGAGTGTVLAMIYVVMAAGYPTARRSTGLGLGMMLGRVGGILATFFGGRLLGATAADSSPFFVTVIFSIVAAIGATLLIDRHLPAGGRARRS